MSGFVVEAPESRVEMLVSLLMSKACEVVWEVIFRFSVDTQLPSFYKSLGGKKAQMGGTVNRAEALIVTLCWAIPCWF